MDVTEKVGHSLVSVQLLTPSEGAGAPTKKTQCSVNSCGGSVDDNGTAPDGGMEDTGPTEEDEDNYVVLCANKGYKVSWLTITIISVVV